MDGNKNNSDIHQPINSLENQSSCKTYKKIPDKNLKMKNEKENNNTFTIDESLINSIIN